VLVGCNICQAASGPAVGSPSRDVIGHVTIWFAIMQFPIIGTGGTLEPFLTYSSQKHANERTNQPTINATDRNTGIGTNITYRSITEVVHWTEII